MSGSKKESSPEKLIDWKYLLEIADEADEVVDKFAAFFPSFLPEEDFNSIRFGSSTLSLELLKVCWIVNDRGGVGGRLLLEVDLFSPSWASICVFLSDPKMLLNSSSSDGPKGSPPPILVESLPILVGDLLLFES